MQYKCVYATNTSGVAGEDDIASGGQGCYSYASTDPAALTAEPSVGSASFQTDRTEGGPAGSSYGEILARVYSTNSV